MELDLESIAALYTEYEFRGLYTLADEIVKVFRRQVAPGEQDIAKVARRVEKELADVEALLQASDEQVLNLIAGAGEKGAARAYRELAETISPAFLDYDGKATRERWG
ncbi:hypothetical protein, partial [Thermogutta sp.]|uniref:hypothetical protein n=1 Tax=Thermogutta sp. TaxID=1962930 RepID=UPI0032201FAB